MEIHHIFLLISSLLAFSAPFFYSYEILTGKAKPHRTTRLVLLVITALAFFALLAQHDTVAVWLAGIGLFQSTLIFLLSFKYGMGGWDKLDILCLGIAAIGIVIWKVTSNPILALYAAIIADFTGVVPTLLKTYHKPESESLLYFLIDVFACGFSLLAIEKWSLQDASYPGYLVAINALIVLLVLRPKIQKCL